MNADLTKTYGQVQNSALGGRAAEAEAFAKSARNLHQAASEPLDPAALKDALQSNLKLWTLLQVSLSEDEGRLPKDLRQDILRLSIFVDKQTLVARAALSLDAVEPLIEINRNMASGLFQKPSLRPV
ncbi:MAG: flagellar biosynthesis regulator FlaF [Rhodospirillales bacterium]|nr:flagellar biosynthesis regulator FlaF [Rhodospirillales bacterium]